MKDEVYQSQRRTLRNYYAAIHMGLNNPPDIELAKHALDSLIRNNEDAIIVDELNHKTMVE